MRKNTTYSRRPSHAARAAHARGDRQFRTYDTSMIAPERKGVNAFTVIIVIVALALVAGLGFGIWKLFFSAKEDTTYTLAEAGTQVQVEIPEGALTSDIATELGEAGLIDSYNGFVDTVTSKDAASSLKPGTYTLTAGTSVDDLVQALVDGPGMGKSVSIPEGYTVEKIAEAADEATDGDVTAKTFVKKATKQVADYAKDYSFIGDATTLEGFLFPKTYEVGEKPTSDSLIRQMLDQYQQETADLDYSYPESQGLSKYETLILASIVEKESDENTRAKVAAVFYNRLKTTGEPNFGYLQSDATTAYEVGHDPTAEEVHADSEYSTYTHQGLPPTPICSPGIDALQAVCNPDMDTINDGYYYFYFKEDKNGQMQYYFSKTLEEHNKAIAEA